MPPGARRHARSSRSSPAPPPPRRRSSPSCAARWRITRSRATSSSAHCRRHLRVRSRSSCCESARRKPERRPPMPKYLIEREIPGAGKLTPQELQGVAQKSCGVLQRMGPQIHCVHSYVTGDKVYCVYVAPNEEMVRKHAAEGGFPANRISEIVGTIDPTTAEKR